MRWIVCFCLFSIVSGCASQRVVDDGSVLAGSENYWWRAKFRLHWPRETEPDFSYHLLIADQIVSPVIDQFRDKLILWRFHRRAARDDAGHQFTFLYYAKRQDSVLIQQAIRADPMISQLREGGVLDALLFTGAKRNGSNLVEGTSDTMWPVEIQKSWPYFIMGVSQSWLDLIARERDGAGEVDQYSMVQLVDYYDQLNDRIVDKWGRFGRHAYLHHINAIFGYTPVYIQDTEQWQSF